MPLYIAPVRERWRYAFVQAWEPQYDIKAAVIVAVVVGAVKRDMSAVLPAVYAGLTTFAVIYALRFLVKLWQSSAVLSVEQFKELEASYQKSEGKAREAAAQAREFGHQNRELEERNRSLALTLQRIEDGRTKITRVLRSSLSSRDGHFDLLADTLTVESTAVDDWKVWLVVKGETREFAGVIQSGYGMPADSKAQFCISFPYQGSNPADIVAAHVMRLRGVDNRGREVLYEPEAPLALLGELPDIYENGERRARMHAQYLVSIGTENDANYVLKRLIDARQEKQQLEARQNPDDSRRIDELTDEVTVATSTLTRMMGSTDRISVGDIMRISGMIGQPDDLPVSSPAEPPSPDSATDQISESVS